jgi:hypothetical protein
MVFGSYPLRSIMVSILLVSIALNCPEPVIINNTSEWNEVDEKSYQIATSRCAEHYPDAPCLKSFYKTEENVYRALCGTKFNFIQVSR